MFKETCDNKQMLQMFQSNVSIVNACLWMLDAHAHVMQVKLCKANTRGVTNTRKSDSGVIKIYWQYLGSQMEHGSGMSPSMIKPLSHVSCDYTK